ncbi:MAG: hypothetical protein A2958_01285 [Candidatus Levybacteria bacterium RIFCSPLOWO2_01_FULL_38_13]|nr:MAG: hypothetical protein A2629_01145 [Candidatus Levybacteria bacterium RIFCSPHIGHO2_01_FULL_41_15]OGH35787.1 MAG: hypothetical protein A2958_01285 [Candidatus Levybacteria bacterium RIFCSPLOWO2_01_FULL_38_13]
MENHPIPQDITGFQFKLIGDMTIKQFAYLATGVVLGWITFALPIFILIKIPLVLLFVGLGVGAAFVPIEGRPFDLMISNYIKALFNPTQYIYQKIGGHMWFPKPPKESQVQTVSKLMTSSDSTQKLKEFLKNLPQKPKDKLDEKELNFLNSLLSLSKGSPTDISENLGGYEKIFEDQIRENVNLTDEGKKKEEEKELDKKADVLKKELEEAKDLEKKQETGEQYQMAHQKILEIEKVLSEVTSQKQILENQIIELRKKLKMQGKNIYSPSTITPKPETKHARRIPRELSKTAGLPFIPDVPNLVMGIAKDSRNNPLPNILVEVKDEEGNPVRAFKTNVLGQFASATPLGNGVYTIFFEDPKGEHKFDTIEIEARGEVLMPLEIISIDKREELRRELFNPVQKS